MARTQAKFTAQLGKPYKGDIAVAAGDAETQSETISINIDRTKMSKGEALILIESIRDAVHASDWPVPTS